MGTEENAIPENSGEIAKSNKNVSYWQQVLKDMGLDPSLLDYDKIDVQPNPHIGNGVKTGQANKLIGYKASSFVLGPGKPHFISPTFPTNYGVTSVAVCKNELLHASFARIDPKCTCGWHSFKTIEPAIGYVNHVTHFFGIPVLKTVISGEFIEYEQGYRSEKQRITDVLYHSCSYYSCNNDAVLVYKKGYSLYGVCKNHSMFYSKIFTFDQLTSILSRFYPEHKTQVRSAYGVEGLKEIEWKQSKKRTFLSPKHWIKYIGYHLSNSLFQQKWSAPIAGIIIIGFLGAIAGSVIYAFFGSH